MEHYLSNHVTDMEKGAKSTPSLVVPATGNASVQHVASISGDTGSKSVTPPHFVYMPTFFSRR